MKRKSNRFLAASLATFAVLCQFTLAADYYWDAATVTVDGVSQGGTAAWTVGAPGWEDGTSAQNWANNNTAILGGTAGTLTLGGGITSDGITVQSSGYRIDGAQSLTAGQLNIGTGASLEIANSTSALSFSGLSGAGTLAINKGASNSNISAMNAADSLSFTGTLQLRGGAATTTPGTVAGNWIMLGGASVTQAAGTAFALDTGTSTSNAKDFIMTDSWGGKTLTLSSLSGHGSIRRDAGGANNTTIRVNQAATTTFNGLILSHTSTNPGTPVRSIDFIKDGAGTLTLAGLVGKQTATAGAENSPVNLEVAGGTLVMTANNTTTGSLTVRNGALLRMENGSAGTGFTGGNTSMTGSYTIDTGGEIQAFRNGTAAFGTGTMIMNGGSLFQVQGNWTWTNAITLNDSTSSIIGNKGTGSNRWLKLQGTIGGSGNLTLNDPTGALTNGDTGILLTGTNTLSGTLTVDTFVRVGGVTGNDITTAAGPGGSLGSAAVVINSGKRLTFSRSDAHTVSNTISGAGSVHVGATGITGSGTQVLTLSGTNSYAGATQVNTGTLNLTGSLTSAVNVGSGARLTGSGSTNQLLTMNGGSTLTLAGGATTNGLAANGVTFAGPVSLNFASPPIASTVYDVLGYGSGAVTDIVNLSVLYRGTLSDDTVNNKYIFTAGGVGTRTWNSVTNDGYWDLGFANNWLEGDQKFFGGDTVIFGAITGDQAITLEGQLMPGSVTVNNATHTYTFTGVAGVSEIIGGGTLTKNNAGTLAIASNQSYTGGTIINGGILDLSGGGGASGTIRGTATVNSGGTLRLSTGDATGYGTDATRLSVINLVGGTLHVNTIANQTLGSAVINMTGGSITGITGSNLDFFAGASAVNTFASAAESTISLPSLNLRQDNTVFTVEEGEAVRDLVISTNMGNGSAGAHNLNKAGAGHMVLTGTNSYTGNTTVSAGKLTVQGTTNGTANVIVGGAGSLLVPTGGSLTATGALSTAFATGASIVVENGATLTAASANVAWNPATFQIDGALNLSGILTVSTNATAPITGAGVINAGGFAMGNAVTTANFSAAEMILSGSIKLGSTTAAHSTRLNQNAGTITANGGLQLGDAVSTATQTYALNGGTLNLGSAGITTAGTGTRTVLLGSGTVGATAPWSTTVAMALTSTTTGTEFNTTGGNISLSGALSGDGAKLVKSGAGTLTLTGANSYTGDTVVNAGTLSVNGVSIANSGKLVINGGKVDVSGTEVVDTLFFGATQKAAGTWGSTSSSATNKDDAYFSGTGVVWVSSGPGGGYSTWADDHAGGGTAGEDFDKDGVSNGIEYFLGETGSTFTANPGVVAGKVTWPNGGNIGHTAYGTEFVVQTSSNLSTWTNVTAGDSNLNNTSGSVQYTLPTGAGKIFVRLVVTPN
jgi:fibronectin-binding autotransporter adhesin